MSRAIKRIIADYSAGEEAEAKKQHREAVLLPDFSAHHLRHYTRAAPILGRFSGKEPYKAVWCKNRIGGLV